MLNSIVHIKSAIEGNQSFGTGFVICNAQEGNYILTCNHVLDAVQIARVELQEVEIIVQNSFLDMAIIFLPSLHHKEVDLQLADCPNLNVKSVVFSRFKENLVQKNTLYATLFKDFIELHSTEDDAFYLIKKLKADENYNFEKGNSGAPIICTQTGNVIAMLSNKEGRDIAYAIGVSCVSRLLEQVHANPELLEQHRELYENMKGFQKEVLPSIKKRKSTQNRTIYNIDELEKEKSTFIATLKERLFKVKYFFLGVLTILALYGAYSFFKQEKIATHEYYQVTNLPSYETLNVREGEGQAYRVIDELPSNAKNIIVYQCKYNDASKKWCKIQYKNIKGWVHSHYIEKSPKTNSH